MLEVRNLAVRQSKKTIVEDISFSVSPSQWLMIVGPNGAGKTTVLKALTRAIPSCGELLFDGRDVRGLSPRQLAKSMGTLAQSHFVNYSFTVEEVIGLGLYAHSKGPLSRKIDGYDSLVRDAAEMTGMEPLMFRPVTTLSGGELQRTFLAQLFAQNPKLLLLDEPASHLDPLYQKQIFDLIQYWLRKPGRAVVSVVHDLGLARTYGTDGLIITEGKIKAFGKAEEVLVPEVLNPVFGMDLAGWMKTLYGSWN